MFLHFKSPFGIYYKHSLVHWFFSSLTGAMKIVTQRRIFDILFFIIYCLYFVNKYINLVSSLTVFAILVLEQIVFFFSNAVTLPICA